MSISLNFTEQDWEGVERNWKAWWAGELHRPLVMIDNPLMFSCCMISPEMFERFVLPDLAACVGRLDHAFYHLDGKGQIRHLDMLLSLEKLAGIQWIPGDGQPPPDGWLPLLKRIRNAGKLCQLYVSARGARAIVKELGGRGFAFYVVSSITSREEAEDYLRVLATEDVTR